MSHLRGKPGPGAAPGLRRWLAASLCAFLAFALPAQPGSAFQPWWVQNHAETQLWSGPDAQAISFGRVPQWSYFKVVAPQQGSRLHVFNPITQNYAYVDAAAVGPSSPPPAPAGVSSVNQAQPPAANPAPGYQPWWVSNFVETELWSGPGKDATSLGKVPQFRRFMVVEPQSGDRLRVWSPERKTQGYIDAAAVGPSGPSVWVDPKPPRVVRQIGIPGRAVGKETYVRNLPIDDDETVLRRAPNNTPVFVRDLVAAADGTEWYTIGDGEYLRTSEVRLPRRPEAVLEGRWIDADLSEPTMLTAYEGNRVVYTALAIKGFAATATPKGQFQIVRRVENETMDSETIGIPRNAPGGYYLKDVLYTQYFTWDGASIHYNYWLGTFGYPGSHGCLGLNLADSKWFWDWATVGTPVIIR